MFRTVTSKIKSISPKVEKDENYCIECGKTLGQEEECHCACSKRKNLRDSTKSVN